MAVAKQSEYCEALTARIKAWFADKNAVGVSMEIEDLDWNDPDLPPYEDYYEVRTFCFRPDSLEKASAELSVTEDDGVSLSIETRRRVFERCARASLSPRMAIFAMWPVDARLEDVITVLDFAADGELVIDAFRWGGCLFVVPASVPPIDFNGFLHEVNTSGISAKNRRRLLSWVRARKTTLRYQPWSEKNRRT